MTSSNAWWPLELSPRAATARDTWAAHIMEERSALDASTCATLVHQLDDAMRFHLGHILESDTLPHFAHVINGWGNVVFQGRSMFECLDRFIHAYGTRRALLQCDPEGDFHPWQTLAYAVMAGASPTTRIGSTAGGVTMLDLCHGSRHLNTDEGREFGHLLFALAHLDPEGDGIFHLKTRAVSLDDLLTEAITAHDSGTFEVCRKFHLTEGLCAATSLMPPFEEFRPDDEAFLAGQCEMLPILRILLAQAMRQAARIPAERDTALLDELRSSLYMGPYVENHCYYAGHLVELLCFAHRLGFAIDEIHWQSAICVLNTVNQILISCLPRISFADAFLHLGHYRRALTLAEQILVRRLPPGELDLAGYTLIAEPPVEVVAPDVGSLPSTFDVAPPSSVSNADLEEDVPRFGTKWSDDPAPIRWIPHFRSLMMPGWPRAVHYEFWSKRGRV